MRHCDVFTRNSRARLALLSVVPSVLMLTLSASAFAQSSAEPPVPASSLASTHAPSADTLKSWHKGMARVPLPKTSGCFTSQYPSSQWQEVPCRTAPLVPFAPTGGVRNAGNTGGDVTAQVTTGFISLAVGSFESVNNVTSLSGPSTNDFSLQLNTNVWTSSPTCSGGIAGCEAWQQFVYSQSSQEVFMQYWLINYASNGNASCPAGWTSFGNDCFENSPAAFLLGQATLGELGSLSMIGQANANGNDVVILGVGTILYAAQNSDSVLDLAQAWTEAEYNIFGDGNGTEAVFNAGASITVRTSVDNGHTAAPSCQPVSFTGETNNLNFASAPTAQRGTSPAIIFTESTSGASSACAAATEVASGWLTDTHDFNGNTGGTSDILWRNSSSTQLAVWLMSNAQVSSAATVAGAVPATWSVVGTRDFNGDGNADILWLDSSGDLAVWLMDGNLISAHNSIGNVGTQWSVVGTGDFNDDGYGDILWRNTTTGDTAVWLMNNGAFSSAIDLGVVPTAWQIAGTGDFNGDGTTDILWRNTTTGDTTVWLMHNGSFSSGADLGTVPLTWSVVGTGDFNGNGTSDILWRDSSGNTAIWLISNGAFSSGGSLGQISTVWSVAETGDFNGDGKSDILWLDTSGDIGLWMMNGTAISSAVGLGNVGSTWTVQGKGAD